MKKLSIFFALCIIGISGNAQTLFTKADTLRGSLNENRDWFDILKYHIYLEPNIEKKSIAGVVIWKAKQVKAAKKIQVDLQQPLVIDSIKINNATPGYEFADLNAKKVSFVRNENTAIVDPGNTNFKNELRSFIL